MKTHSYQQLHPHGAQMDVLVGEDGHTQVYILGIGVLGISHGK